MLGCYRLFKNWMRRSFTSDGGNRLPLFRYPLLLLPVYCGTTGGRIGSFQHHEKPGRHREVRDEALTGEPAGQPLSRESFTLVLRVPMLLA
jgi:hypothetical protein